MKRMGIGAALLFLLGGPTPGAVGACEGDDSGDFADIVDYCQEREELICVRRALRKELSTEERDDCRREVIDLCERRAWSADCRPTNRQADACLNALRSMDTLDTPEDELDECKTKALCTVRTGAPTSIGDDGGMP